MAGNNALVQFKAALKSFFRRRKRSNNSSKPTAQSFAQSRPAPAIGPSKNAAPPSSTPRPVTSAEAQEAPQASSRPRGSRVLSSAPQIPPIRSSTQGLSVEQTENQSPVSAMSRPTSGSLKAPSSIEEPTSDLASPQELRKGVEEDVPQQHHLDGTHEKSHTSEKEAVQQHDVDGKRQGEEATTEDTLLQHAPSNVSREEVPVTEMDLSHESHIRAAAETASAPPQIPATAHDTPMLDTESPNTIENTLETTPVSDPPSKDSFLDEKEVVLARTISRPEPEEKISLGPVYSSMYNGGPGGMFGGMSGTNALPMQATSGPLQDYYVEDLEH